MSEFIFDAADETATDRLGAALAAVLPPGTTIALMGTLGAGKTRLVQAICAGLGVAREDVVSPTFVLCQRYDGTQTIHHLDAYRLKDEDEFRELGVEELYDSPGLTIIEWADRVADCLPEERLEIQIDVIGQTERRFTIRTVGERLVGVLAALHQACGSAP
jgi:tRNA threonylcarbamoyladenosine biosynthesis protein TsaE